MCKGAGDLGIDCLFTDRLAHDPLDSDQQAPRISWVDGDLQFVGARPQPGDRLLAIGGKRVPTFLHVKRRVAELGGQEPWQEDSVVRSNDDIGILREPPLRADDAKSPESPFPRSGPSLAQIGATRWVRIEFLAASVETGVPELTRDTQSESIASTSLNGRQTGSNHLPKFEIRTTVWRPGHVTLMDAAVTRDGNPARGPRSPALESRASTEDQNNSDAAARTKLVLKSAWIPLRTLPNRFLMLSAGWFLLEAIILMIGALVVLNRPGDRSAVMFYALCVVHVVCFLGAFHWSSLVGTRVLVYPFVFCTILLAPATLHFYLVFPRPSRWIRRRPLLTLAAIYSMPAIWTVLMFVCLWQAHRLYEGGAAPPEVTRWLGVLSASISGYLFVAAGMFVVGWGVLLGAHRRARSAAQRNQIRWVIVAVALATALTAYLLILAIVDRAAFAFSDSTRVALYLTSVLFTLAYAVSITRYKLMQVGRLVNRGMLYVIISLAATALYCLLVGVGTALLGRYYFRWENAVAAGLAAMLVAVLLGWLRDRFQTTLDRRYIREKYQLNDAMRRLSEAVAGLVEPDALARQFLNSAATAVGVNRGSVYLRDAQSGSFLPTVASGSAVSDERIDADSPLLNELRIANVLTGRVGLGTLPSPGQQELRDRDGDAAVALELDGDVIGIAILGEKAQGAPYSTEDLNFLSSLARTTTLALRNARESRRIEAQKRRLQAQVEKISQLQQQVHVLQSELLTIDPASSSDARDAKAPSLQNPSELPFERSDELQAVERNTSKDRDKVSSAAPRESDGNGDPQHREATLTSHDADRMTHTIRGSSPAVKKMLRDSARVARTDSSVLVRGESGTGKELLARAIHDNGRRAAMPFVAVHCAALSSGLLESELFGHVKGAFTGADRDRVGRFQLADGGTLFLDEIGDISLETQTKLLRVLEARSFERVGATKTIQVDVRLITATHQNLEELIRKGQFRQDLFYRLNVISVWCPPLRNRRADIFELSLHFLRQFARRLSGDSDSAPEGPLGASDEVVSRATAGLPGSAAFGPDLSLGGCQGLR